MTAADAWRIGLVNRVVARDELLPTAERMAQAIASNGPLAVQAVKRTVLAASGKSLEDAYELENEAKALVMASEDAIEGPRAFMEKRAPNFCGR
jgi:enoyl-CoA hydratase